MFNQKQEQWEQLRKKGIVNVDTSRSNKSRNRLHDVSVDSVGRDLPDVGDVYQYPFPPDIKNVK